MARSFTVSELITLAKQYADQVGESFVSDAEWRAYLSAGYAQLYSALVRSGMRYFESEQEIESDGDATGDYALPSDFLSVCEVYRLLDGTSTGRRQRLSEVMTQARSRYAGVSGSEATGWSLVGANLRLHPSPPSGQLYSLVYVPQPTKIATDGSSDSESIDVVTMDGEQYLLWYAVFQARDKGDENVMNAMRERDSALERVKEWATLRALNSPREPMVLEDLDWYDGDPSDWWYGRGGH